MHTSCSNTLSRKNVSNAEMRNTVLPQVDIVKNEWLLGQETQLFVVVINKLHVTLTEVGKRINHFKFNI